ncbi:CHAT domain-containing protein [bacterium]|nr:CHAT domain-containing protein [bacterium]
MERGIRKNRFFARAGFLSGSFIFIIFFLICFNLYAKETDLPELVQITTHPEADFQPSVSPDGKRLAFVSSRSVNTDIWILKLPRGVPCRITRHSADDFLPSWSPDGKSIAFVSRRFDAFGDIWIAEVSLLKNGAKLKKLRRVTEYRGVDISPVFSPDGRYIAYTSTRSGKRNIWVYDLKEGSPFQITAQGGFEPSWSPSPSGNLIFTSVRKEPGGDLFLININNPEILGGKVVQITKGRDADRSAKFSPLGDEIVFVRQIRKKVQSDGSPSFEKGVLFVKKINADSLISGNQTLTDSPEIQITTNFSGSSCPSWGIDNKIYFGSDYKHKLDIWSIPAHGIIPQLPDARSEYEKILERSGEAVSLRALSQILISLKSLVKRFPSDSLIKARSLIQQGEIYLTLNDTANAYISFNKAYFASPHGSSEKGRAFLKRSYFSEYSTNKKIEECTKIAEVYRTNRRIQAEALIQKGGLLIRSDNHAGALEAYTKVLSLFPYKSNFRAQALLKIGDIFAAQSEQNMADNEYLTVLKEYSAVPLWRGRAGERLLSYVSGTLKERVSRLRRIIKDTEDVPSLQAQAHLLICRTLIDSSRYRQSAEELKSTAQLFPDIEWAKAKADIMLASVYEAQEDELKAIFLLEDVEKEYSLTEGGRFASQAREMRFSLLMKTAERLFNAGDFALAEARFRQALKLHPEDFKVHRGLVKSAFYNGTIDALLKEYEEKVNNKSRPSIFYGYGLAFSFKGEKNRKKLTESNKALSESLKQDYQQPYPYLTLSYNYELIEDYIVRERSRKKGILRRIRDIIYSPVSMIYGFFRGESSRGSNFHEKAIQTLITGIEVNDEKKNPKLEVMLLQNLANNFYKLGQYGYGKALFYYQKRLDTDTTFLTNLEKAVFYQRAGHCGVFTQDTTVTVKYLTIAAKTFKKISKVDEELRSLNLIAFYYYLSDRYEDALPIYQQIGMRYERMGRYRDAELAFRNLAYNFYLLEEPREVITEGKRAEKMLPALKGIPEKASDKYVRIELLGLSIPIWKVSTIGPGLSEGVSYSQEAALIYGLISRSMEDMGVVHEAISYELKRLELFRNSGDKLAERVCLNRIGVLFLKLGNDDKSWDYLLEAFQKCIKAKDKAGTRLTTLNLGYTALKDLSGKWDSDKGDFARKILSEELERNNSTDRISKIEILNILGGIEFSEAQNLKYKNIKILFNVKKTLKRFMKLEQSVRYFLQARAFADQYGNFYLRGVIDKNLAEVWAASGEYEEALKTVSQAERFIRKSGDLRPMWRIIYAKARFLSAISDSAGPEIDSLYTKAVEFRLKVPPNETVPFSLVPVEEEHRKLFDDAAMESVKKGDIPEAVRILEQGKQREIAEFVSISEPLFRKENHKIIWKNYLYAKKEAWILSESSGAKRRNRERIKKQAERELEKYRHAIQQEDDVLAYFAGAYEFSLSKFQNILPDDEAAILFIPGHDSSYVAAVTRDSVYSGIIPYPYKKINSAVSGFKEEFYNSSLSKIESRHIFDLLLSPMKRIINKKKSLMFVQSGFVHNLPFEALADDKGFLGMEKNIRYCPDLSYALIAQNRPRINQKSLLSITDTRSNINVKNYGNLKVNVLSGRDATPEALHKALSGADMFIFSKRFFYRDTDPFGTTLFLAADTSSEGLISLRDLFSFDIKASIAILESRKKITDDELSVFAYTLLYGGVPSVLWIRKPVPENTEDAFLTGFFRSISSMSFESAFFNARFQTKDDTAFSWACFSFMGFNGFSIEKRRLFAMNNINKRLSVAYSFYKKRDYKTSKKYLEEALDMAAAIGDTAKQHSIYRQLVSVSIKAGMWESVVFYQKKIIGDYAFKPGRHYKIEMSRFVSILVKAGQFRQAAAIQKEIAVKAESGIKREEAVLYLAFLYSRAREFKKGAIWADSAKVMAEKRGDSIDEAKALLFKGKFLVEGDSSLAGLMSLKQGIAMLKSNGGQNSDIQKNIASGYQLLGLAYEKLGRYNEALDAQTEGLSLFKDLGFKVQQVQGMQYMANLLWKRGQYKEALEYQEKALVQLKKGKDQNLLAAGYSTRGLIDMDIGNEDRAMVWLEKALSIAENGKNALNEATILKNMGLVSIRKKEYKRAMEFFRRAVKVDSVAEYKRGLAYDQVDLGLLLIELGNLKKAKAFLQRGLELSRQINDKRDEVKALLALGRTLNLLKKRKMSLAVLDTAYNDALNLGAPTFLWRIARQRGLVLKETGRKKEAIGELKEAVRIVEKVRRDLKVEELKQGFFGTKTDLYADVVSMLLDMGEKEEAFLYAERAQSRSFIDMLADKEIELSAEKSDVIQKINAVRKTVESLEDSIEVVKASFTGKDLLKKLRRKLEVTQREYAIRVSNLKTSYPELASLITVDPLSAAEVQEMLPDSVGLVKYFVTDKSVIIWFISNNRIEVKQKDIPSGHLKKLVYLFRENIQAYLSVDNLSRALYSILIRPVEGLVFSEKHLIISPHKVLHYLPFAALKRGDGLYLIDKISVSSVPSVSVMRFCINSKKGINRKAQVFAIGNPAVKGKEPLVFAEREIKAITRSFPDCRIYTGEKATEGVVRKYAGSYNVLHFACHAVYNEKAPLKSSLFLMPDKKFDGLLEAKEIFGLKVKADLVTLSGCETGMSKVSPGDEIIGFTRSFIFAGASSLVSSLWKVSDLETAVLVKRFYRALSKGQSKAGALRNAQLIVKKMVNSHPAAWAGFTLTGDYQ